MGIPSDYRFIRGRRQAAAAPVPGLPDAGRVPQAPDPALGQIEALIAHFARQSPGFFDDLLLVDSTPVECARSRETVKRGGGSSLADALTDAADYGYCASHSRYFFGFRLHALFAPDGTPRALALTSPKIDEKLVCLQDGRPLRAPARPGADPDRRQELPRQGLRDRARQARRHDHATPPQRRARPRPAPRADPPADRIDLLDLQRHPHTRAPRRPHPATTSASGSAPASPHSPPRSCSTTNSAAPAAASSTTSPNPVALIWRVVCQGPAEKKSLKGGAGSSLSLDWAWLRVGAFSGRHERKASLLDCGVRLISEGFYLKTLCSLRLALYRRALPSKRVEVTAQTPNASFQATICWAFQYCSCTPRESLGTQRLMECELSADIAVGGVVRRCSWQGKLRAAQPSLTKERGGGGQSRAPISVRMCAKPCRALDGPNTLRYAVLVECRGLPEKRGELAGDSDSDHARLACDARCGALPATVKASLRAPGDLDDARVLAGLAARELDTDRRLMTVVMGCLDQQPPRVLRTGLGDRALPADPIGGALRGDDPEKP